VVSSWWAQLNSLSQILSISSTKDRSTKCSVYLHRRRVSEKDDYDDYDCYDNDYCNDDDFDCYHDEMVMIIIDVIVRMCNMTTMTMMILIMMMMMIIEVMMMIR